MAYRTDWSKVGTLRARPIEEVEAEYQLLKELEDVAAKEIVRSCRRNDVWIALEWEWLYRQVRRRLYKIDW